MSNANITLPDRPAVLVTGATGMVGGAVLARLHQDGHRQLSAAIRRPMQPPVPARTHAGLSLESADGWREALQGSEVVVHAAARVHVMNDRSSDPLAEFRRVNVDGSLRVARLAAAAGVRRFVYVSSIKVNGEVTPRGRPFTEDQPAAPRDPYGLSKLEAEQRLRELAGETGMELVIIRPPLVYGPGVGANFFSLMRSIDRGIPLPLAGIDNRRSLIGLDNLASLIAACTTHPAAASRVFLACDDESLSTPELVRRLAHALGRPARLVTVPASWLKTLAQWAGKATVAQRLCESLEVDGSLARRLLAWHAPSSVDEGLRRTARWYRDGERSKPA